MKKTMFAVFLTALVFCSVPAYAQDVWDVNLDTILKAMSNNSARAAAEYKDYRIRTWGIVKSILNDSSVMVGGGDEWLFEYLTVEFNASERSKVLNLNRGQLITFVGYSVDNYGSLEIQNAVVETNTAASYLWNGYIAEIKDGNNNKAIADYTQAIRLDPNFFLAYAYRGSLYNDMRDYNRAVTDYEAAFRLNPDNAGIKEALAEARRKGGKSQAPAPQPQQQQSQPAPQPQQQSQPKAQPQQQNQPTPAPTGLITLRVNWTPASGLAGNLTRDYAKDLQMHVFVDTSDNPTPFADRLTLNWGESKEIMLPSGSYRVRINAFSSSSSTVYRSNTVSFNANTGRVVVNATPGVGWSIDLAVVSR